MKTLRDIGEIDVLKRILRFLPDASDGAFGRDGHPAAAEVVRGAGDDCAVIRLPGGEECGIEWLLTSDPVVEGVHFATDALPVAIGHKVVARVLSDLAAMGASPSCALINVVASPDMGVGRLEAAYESACRTAGQYGLMVVGGDVTSGPVLELHVFAVGQAPVGQSVLRSGACPGDDIYVTGELGGSSQGRHLLFQPRVSEGIWLRDWASSMIDVSDGLATDIRHIMEQSDVGAELLVEALPVSEAALAMEDGDSGRHHALCDGEDFELLFTVPLEKRADFEEAWNEVFSLSCTRIGSVTKTAGLLECRDKQGKIGTLDEYGFAHWSRRRR